MSIQTIKLYLINTNIHGFRTGEPALIIGFKRCVPNKLAPRNAYEVQYEDGFIDYVPVEDHNNFKILTLTEIIINSES